MLPLLLSMLSRAHYQLNEHSIHLIFLGYNYLKKICSKLLEKATCHTRELSFCPRSMSAPLTGSGQELNTVIVVLHSMPVTSTFCCRKKDSHTVVLTAPKHHLHLRKNCSLHFSVFQDIVFLFYASCIMQNV